MIKRFAANCKAPARWLALAAICTTTIGSAAAAPSTRKGTFHITATVSLGPNAPPTLDLTGNASANVSDYSDPSASTSQSIVKHESPIPRTGNVGKVVIDLPYEITFDSASYPKLKFGISLGVGNARVSTQSSLYLPVPDDGATTPITFEMAL